MIVTACLELDRSLKPDVHDIKPWEVRTAFEHIAIFSYGEDELVSQRGIFVLVDTQAEGASSF